MKNILFGLCLVCSLSSVIFADSLIPESFDSNTNTTNNNTNFSNNIDQNANGDASYYHSHTSKSTKTKTDSQPLTCQQNGDTTNCQSSSHTTKKTTKTTTGFGGSINTQGLESNLLNTLKSDLNQ